MNNILKLLVFALCGLVIDMALLSKAHAHFMVAQHGTLNFVDDSVYMVLSLPMSGFELEDADGDGAISMLEFNRQRTPVVAAIRERVRLQDANEALWLQGIMLAPELDHHTETENISQLIVMGKFSLTDSSGELRFAVDLFGNRDAERQLEVRASRKARGITQDLRLTPDANSGDLLADLTAD